MSSCTDDPLPFLHGLYQLIPEERLAFILQRTGRQSQRHRRLPASSVTWLVIAMGLFDDLPIPHVWRRLHPSPPGLAPATPQRRRTGAGGIRLHPGPPAPGRRTAATTLRAVRPAD